MWGKNIVFHENNNSSRSLPFYSLSSKEFFDFENIQVITYYPYSHLGIVFKFLFVLDMVFFFN